MLVKLQTPTEAPAGPDPPTGHEPDLSPGRRGGSAREAGMALSPHISPEAFSQVPCLRPFPYLHAPLLLPPSEAGTFYMKMSFSCLKYATDFSMVQLE